MRRRLTGKGGTQRMVPVLPQVNKLVAEYVALCPYDLPADGALFLQTQSVLPRDVHEAAQGLTH